MAILGKKRFVAFDKGIGYFAEAEVIWTPNESPLTVRATTLGQNAPMKIPIPLLEIGKSELEKFVRYALKIDPTIKGIVDLNGVSWTASDTTDDSVQVAIFLAAHNAIFPQLAPPSVSHRPPWKVLVG